MQLFFVSAYHAVLGQRQQASSTQPNVFMTPGHSPMNQNRTGKFTACIYYN